MNTMETICTVKMCYEYALVLTLTGDSTTISHLPQQWQPSTHILHEDAFTSAETHSHTHTLKMLAKCMGALRNIRSVVVT